MSYNAFVTNLIPLFNVTSNGSGPVSVVDYGPQINGFQTMLSYSSYTLNANSINAATETFININSDLYLNGQLYINTYPFGPDANGSNFTSGTSYTVEANSSTNLPNSSNPNITFITNNVVAFTIDSNADAVFTNSLTANIITCQKLYQVSDERLNTNSIPIISSLSTLISLNAVQYGFLGQSTLGFIAQDVNLILPSIVDTTNPNKFSIDYSQIIPLLVESVKELNSKVKALELVVRGLM